MPAQVLRKRVVGCELIANAVTSEMESQQVELMPSEWFSMSADMRRVQIQLPDMPL